MNADRKKRELTLQIDGQEITVTAYREGDEIVVDRAGIEHRVKVTGDRIILPDGGVSSGQPAATGPAPPAATAPSRAVSPAPAAPSPAPAAGAGSVASPMVGVVKEVLISSGDSVESGQRVIVLEAMKMDIDVVAPEDGTVVAVHVGPGDNVKEGQALVQIGAGGE